MTKEQGKNYIHDVLIAAGPFLKKITHDNFELCLNVNIIKSMIDTKKMSMLFLSNLYCKLSIKCNCVSYICEDVMNVPQPYFAP